MAVKRSWRVAAFGRGPTPDGKSSGPGRSDNTYGTQRATGYGYSVFESQAGRADSRGTVPDGPIVHSGQVGASHRHPFSGNRTTDAGSTPASACPSAPIAELLEWAAPRLVGQPRLPEPPHRR